MRRLVVLMVATIGLVGVAVPAAATPSRGSLNRAVSGPYTGTQTFDFVTGGCTFVHQMFDATYAGDGGQGSFHIDTCVTINGSSFDYAGTFVVTTPHGATLTGTVTGFTDAALPASSLDLTLTITHGTRRFEHATGTIALSGTWSNDPGILGHGPTSGTLTGNVAHG